VEVLLVGGCALMYVYVGLARTILYIYGVYMVFLAG
jgi:type IV secretory pathway VirB2 component (pilin)